MSLLVCKFGGSSVASIEKIERIAEKLKTMQASGYRLVVVVSAMGDTTDDLLAWAGQISSLPDQRELDMLLSTGEQQSAALLAMCLHVRGCPAISLTGWQAGILSDEIHSKARIYDIDTERIERELEAGRIVIVAGFQGIAPNGDITTLGRGGSDTSAVALAAGLKAERCLIFTDVEGVYTADPRIVPNASKLNHISYQEMLEIASVGAVVLQPRAAEFAMNYQVEVEVLSSFAELPGTLITEVSAMDRIRTVSGVAHDYNVAKIAIFDVPDQPGIAMKIFRALADNAINVDMVIQSQMKGNRNDIAFTIEREELARALPVMNEIVLSIGASGMSYGQDVAKISIVGAGMQSKPGVAADMFEVLAQNDINIQMISTSEIKVSCIIDETQVKQAVLALHERFELDKEI